MKKCSTVIKVHYRVANICSLANSAIHIFGLTKITTVTVTHTQTHISLFFRYTLGWYRDRTKATKYFKMQSQRLRKESENALVQYIIVIYSTGHDFIYSMHTEFIHLLQYILNIVADQFCKSCIELNCAMWQYTEIFCKP